MYLRFYLLFRLYGQISKWRSKIAVKYCEMEGCEANTEFAVKAVLKKSPLNALFIALVFSSIIFGAVLVNFESPMDVVRDSNEFSFIWNGMWLAVVTMTTVGFGDYYAISVFGRIVTVLIIFWGIFLISLVVVALTNLMDLDHKESRAYTILYRLKSRVAIKDKAVKLLTVVLRIKGLDNGFGARIKSVKDPAERDTMIVRYRNSRAELISNLEFLKGLYFEENKNLGTADNDPVEEIKKLTLTIEHDFVHLKKLLITVREIEASLESVN